MTRVPRDDHEAQLFAQLDFLRSSNGMYGRGYRHFAQLLAVHIRVLVHNNPPSSHSLLSQLNVQNTMQFLDSAGEVDEANQMSEFNLVFLRSSTSGPGEYVPFLGTRQNVQEEIEKSTFYKQAIEEFAARKGRPMLLPWQPRDFDTWWTMAVVKDDEGRTFSRKDLVLFVANQDGGAHIDPTLRSQLADLSRNNSLGWSYLTIMGPQALSNPIPAMIRQISYEMHESLLRQFPQLVQYVAAQELPDSGP